MNSTSSEIRLRMKQVSKRIKKKRKREVRWRAKVLSVRHFDFTDFNNELSDDWQKVTCLIWYFYVLQHDEVDSKYQRRSPTKSVFTFIVWNWSILSVDFKKNIKKSSYHAILSLNRFYYYSWILLSLCFIIWIAISKWIIIVKLICVSSKFVKNNLLC